MLRTLFYIPNEVAGMPLFGAGLLLAIWALVSAAVLGWAMWRRGVNSETLGYVPVLLLIGVIIRWLLPALCEENGLPIQGYGMMMFLGVVSGTGLAAWRSRSFGLDPDTVFSVAFWMLLCGIVGGRAFYVIEYWQTQYWPAYTDPNGGLSALVASVASVNKGGLVVYGAFFGGVAAMLAYNWRYPLPVSLLALADLAAPSMALGLALGRIGCMLNGCCYGGLCEDGMGVTFPPGSPPYRHQVESGQMPEVMPPDAIRFDKPYGFQIEPAACGELMVQRVEPDSPAALAGLKVGDQIRSINGFGVLAMEHATWALDQAFYSQRPLDIRLASGATFEVPAATIPARSRPIYPTQLYSTIDGLVICLLLLVYSPFRRRDGEVFAVLISIYPITRFLIECLRCDEAAIFGTGMSISQNVSLLILACAVALWIYILRQPRGCAGRPSSG